MFLKSLVIFTKASYFKKSLHFFENVFKKPQNLSKSPTMIKKNLHLSGINFKMAQILCKSLTLF
jgi:hypothetical protein